jgi:hypothetical protein
MTPATSLAPLLERFFTQLGEGVDVCAQRTRF